MNMEMIKSKQLNQIEDLCKQLLLVLKDCELGDDVINQEITVLAIESGNERQSGYKADVAQQAKATVHQLNTWENEGGNSGTKVSGYSQYKLRGDIRRHRHARR